MRRHRKSELRLVASSGVAVGSSPANGREASATSPVPSRPTIGGSVSADARKRMLRGELLAKAGLAAAVTDELLDVIVDGDERMIPLVKKLESIATLMGEACRKYQRSVL